MLQAIIRKGKVNAEDVPAPIVSRGSLLIKVVYSCISAGTEMSSVASSGKSIIRKALDQPEKVRKALNMIVSQGPRETLAKIQGKLEPGVPTGYSVSGVVLAIGEGVSGFAPGDAVAAAGAGIANHAEFVDVPANLVMKMPAGLSFREASTVTLGGIALQGVRRADLRIGEFCVVYGAGILGLLAAQMLQRSGARVIVIDLNDRRLEIAGSLGVELTINGGKEDAVKVVNQYTGGFGADAVLFTAATGSSEPLSQSFQICKKKGKVVLVGVVGMSIKREDMYAKELDFIISTSYGPGRYDSNYEQKGLDYPYAYVRWTENRNMTEYLRLIKEGSVKLDKLIEGEFPITDVTEAFESLNGASKPLMVLLSYGEPSTNPGVYTQHDRKVNISSAKATNNTIRIALVGTGGFATGMHLPNIARLNDKYSLHAVVNRTGHKANAIARQYGAKYATTDVEEILNDREVDLVLICTRHDSHAQLTLKALRAGKNVFVEKPLATTREELEQIEDFYKTPSATPKPLLFVGFNRRFSPYATEAKKHTDKRINPLFMHYRMNAGYIPLDSWVHEDGGRIVGEACHIIDLMTFFTGSRIRSISAEELTPANEKISSADNKSIILKYEDGSVGTLEYFAIGSRDLSKEHMELHFDEKSIVMDDYKSLKGYGVSVKDPATPVSEKGQLEELHVLYHALKKGEWPIPLSDLLQTTFSTFLLQ
jgi:predicted dehydrogenase/threonine dehydrogenase-like Zn-dependent dehydrogenase